MKDLEIAWLRTHLTSSLVSWGRCISFSIVDHLLLEFVSGRGLLKLSFSVLLKKSYQCICSKKKTMFSAIRFERRHMKGGNGVSLWNAT